MIAKWMKWRLLDRTVKSKSSPRRYRPRLSTKLLRKSQEISKSYIRESKRVVEDLSCSVCQSQIKCQHQIVLPFQPRSMATMSIHQMKTSYRLNLISKSSTKGNQSNRIRVWSMWWNLPLISLRWVAAPISQLLLSSWINHVNLLTKSLVMKVIISLEIIWLILIIKGKLRLCLSTR